ncbi:MAG: monofunctional biosynthetic peptidoglycan transglycosylase [Bacteroidota bacterium]
MFSLFALPKIIRWTFRLLLIAVIITIVWVGAYRFINPGKTALMKSREAEHTIEVTQTWVNYEDINSTMPLALICGEDQRFKDHFGFDLKAIEKAINHNLKGGKVKGASTITQQTAKNVFLWEGRSWVRKGLEVWFTFWIEILWSKQRILEIYMNVIETGPKALFGVEAASQHYFKKSASKLTRYQAAQIASIVPCPTSCGMQSSFAYKHRNFILRWMRRYGKTILPQ